MFFKEKRADLIQQNNSQTHETEARHDSWSTFENYIYDHHIYGHHVQSMVKLYVPNGEPCPFPLKSFDVVRRTGTALNVLLESRRDDHRNVDGDQMLPGPWTSFIQFSMLNEKPPNGHTGPWERSTKNAGDTQARVFMARSAVQHIGKALKKKEKKALGNRKVEARQCSKIERNLVHRSG